MNKKDLLETFEKKYFCPNCFYATTYWKKSGVKIKLKKENGIYECEKCNQTYNALHKDWELI